jgi:arginine deiminase
MSAVWYCMDSNLFGTKQVAVVKDCFDWSQERMHLDTIFNIVNSKICVLLDTLIGVESPIRRLVDIYERDSAGNVAKQHVFTVNRTVQSYSK